MILKRLKRLKMTDLDKLLILLLLERKYKIELNDLELILEHFEKRL